VYLAGAEVKTIRIAEDGSLIAPVVMQSEKITLDKAPAAVRETVQKESAGGTVDSIEQVGPADKPFYVVTITKDKQKQVLRLKSDGTRIVPIKATASTSPAKPAEPKPATPKPTTDGARK
jgi:hypothetical protein